jgi:hypothetical protein
MCILAEDLASARLGKNTVHGENGKKCRDRIQMPICQKRSVFFLTIFIGGRTVHKHNFRPTFQLILIKEPQHCKISLWQIGIILEILFHETCG